MGRVGEAHTWRRLAAVQGNPRGTARETGKRTRGTADRMLESRLRQALSRPASFCRLKDRIQDPERASKPPGGLGKRRRCRGPRTGISSSACWPGYHPVRTSAPENNPLRPSPSSTLPRLYSLCDGRRTCAPVVLSVIFTRKSPQEAHRHYAESTAKMKKKGAEVEHP